MIPDLGNKDLQINYSILYPGIYKAWHRHKNQDDYFCVLKGMAQVGIYNLEQEKSYKYFIGEHNPAVVHICAGEWHGLTAVGNEPCGLLYLVTKRYDPSSPDEERRPYDSFVGHDWWLPENK
jgi:dTDP-4-dehydrorhamnose 3,5-epimerase-like enzyme